jgi:hypothetical protein
MTMSKTNYRKRTSNVNNISPYININVAFAAKEGVSPLSGCLAARIPPRLRGWGLSIKTKRQTDIGTLLMAREH